MKADHCLFAQLSSAWHDSVTQMEVRELLATAGDAGKGKLAIWTGR